MEFRSKNNGAGMVNGNAVSGKNHNRRGEKPVPKDPELEAEVVFAKENGYEPPKSLTSNHSSMDRKSNEYYDYDGNVIDLKLIKNIKNGRADKKARSRGVSGCSIKKDGNRFEYGLDCIDLINDTVISDCDSIDEELNEYSDFIVKYSETEIREIIGEYLANGSIDETLLDSLHKFCFNIDTSSRLLKDLILFSTEHGPNGGIGLGIKLLSVIINHDFVNQKLLVEVIEDLINSLEDLMKDYSPKINDTLAIFMAKLVANNVFDEKTLKLLAGKSVGRGVCIEKCYENAIVLAKNQYLLQLECPPAGPFESTQTLSTEFKLVLASFLQNTEDKDAVAKRLIELKVPHFNHEFVYQTGVMAMEKMNENVMNNLAGILKYLVNKEVINSDCIAKGFERLYNQLPDLFLDLPAAYVLALRWTDKSLKEGFISEEIANACPRAPRTRTRTLSEGPDGKLSCCDDENGEKGVESKECNGFKQ